MENKEITTVNEHQIIEGPVARERLYLPALRAELYAGIGLAVELVLVTAPPDVPSARARESPYGRIRSPMPFTERDANAPPGRRRLESLGQTAM
jgi:hypothetical protein